MLVNLLLLRGNLGRPGAGACPVRGHSNVQGDRTMLIWERPPAAFPDRLQQVFGFEPPRPHGFDTVVAHVALLYVRGTFLFDRHSVAEGQSGYVRLDTGGCV